MHSALSPTPESAEAADAVNWLGLWTLYVKEVRRFLNVYQQTIAAPVLTTLLFLAVFALSLGGAGRLVMGIPYGEFLAPGLIMMAMTQNAFANTSSSIVIAKVQGNIVDVLTPPLSPAELTLGYAAAGVTRGLAVGLAVGLVMWLWTSYSLPHPLIALAHAFLACLMLSLLGVLGGIWSEKFDHIAAVTNFLVTPAAFLSGSFYSVSALPEPWLAIAHFNPFFYMIDGFRYGVAGVHDGAVDLGLWVMLGVNAALFALTWRLFAVGYRLKA